MNDSYICRVSEGPRHMRGDYGFAGICLLVVTLSFMLRLIHIRMNKKLDQAETSAYSGTAENEENRAGFRYVYQWKITME